MLQAEMAECRAHRQRRQQDHTPEYVDGVDEDETEGEAIQTNDFSCRQSCRRETGADPYAHSPSDRAMAAAVAVLSVQRGDRVRQEVSSLPMTRREGRRCQIP